MFTAVENNAIWNSWPRYCKYNLSYAPDGLLDTPKNKRGIDLL